MRLGAGSGTFPVRRGPAGTITHRAHRVRLSAACGRARDSDARRARAGPTSRLPRLMRCHGCRIAHVCPPIGSCSQAARFRMIVQKLSLCITCGRISPNALHETLQTPIHWFCCDFLNKIDRFEEAARSEEKSARLKRAERAVRKGGLRTRMRDAIRPRSRPSSSPSDSSWLTPGKRRTPKTAHTPKAGEVDESPSAGKMPKTTARDAYDPSHTQA